MGLRYAFFVFILILPLAGHSTESPPPDPWASLRFLVGEWEGTSEGQPGKGAVTRSYSFVLGDRFIHERNTSTYPSQEKNQKGEIHEHWSFISYDRRRRLLILRQFHTEGFVNQYAQVVEESSAKRIVFQSESLENLDPRWRARETHEILGPDEFIETFELAEPGKEFTVYSRNRFKRSSK